MAWSLDKTATSGLVTDVIFPYNLTLALSPSSTTKLLVAAFHNVVSNQITSIKWDGTDMTPAHAFSGTAGGYTRLYYLIAPTVDGGAHNFVVVRNSSLSACLEVASFKCTSATPTLVAGTNEGTDIPGVAASVATTTTGLSTGNLIVACTFYLSGNAPSAQTGTQLQATSLSGDRSALQYLITLNANDVTMGWTIANHANAGIHVAAFNSGDDAPAGGVTNHFMPTLLNLQRR